MCFKILDWDTEFLGFKTALITLSSAERGLLPDVVRQLNDQQIRLAYWMIPESLSSEFKLPGCRVIYPADIKMTFSKKVPDDFKRLPDQPFVIEEYNRETVDEDLYRLAWLSGRYSRYRRDVNFNSEVFQRLYAVWIEQSVTKHRAEAVYVCRDQDQVIGMVTLEKQAEYARIGLIAVNPIYHGRGIAKSLIYRCQLKAIQEKMPRLFVSTQQDNTEACQLYFHSGFTCVSREYVYHFWLDA